MKISCLIVDDEPLAIKVLENHISKIDFLEICGICRSALEALKFLQSTPVDLIFLDIQMPNLTGLDFVKTLSHPPKVIFTTAYRDYAVESYELNALDYLVKPVSFERFFKAIHKVLELMPTDKKITPERTDTIPSESFIYLKSDKKVFKVILKNILYIESLTDYIIVHTTDQGKISSYQNISHLEEILPKDKFLRIHRSFLISLDHLVSFSASCVFIADVELPIGRTHKEEVLQRLNLQ